MKPSLEELNAMGSTRENDNVLDRDNPVKIRESLSWIHEAYNIKHVKKISDNTPSGKLLEWLYGKTAEIAPDHVALPSDSFFKDIIIKAAQKTIGTLVTNTKNLLQRRKVKKALTVIGSAAVGAAIGAVIGTVVFPAIGTAVGGAVGAALGGVGAAVGAGVGLGIIGAFLGSRVGKSIDKATPKDKSFYRVRPLIAKLLSKNTDLSKDELIKLNAYLNNRQEAVQEPMVKNAIGNIKKKIFREGHMRGAEALVFYLMHELKTLKALPNKNEAQLKDILFLENVLFKLKKLDNIDQNVRDAIVNELKSSATIENTKTEPKQKVRQILRYSEKPSEQIGYRVKKAPLLEDDALHELEANLGSKTKIEQEKVEKMVIHTAPGKNVRGKRDLHYHLQLDNQKELNLRLKQKQKEETSNASISLTCKR